MDIKTNVEQSFRSLLKRMPYRQISVAAICDEANIARKTFYTYFDNKEDIVYHIFKRDVVDPQISLHQLLPSEVASSNALVFNTKLYELILQDKDFYHTLVGPLKGVDDTFIRIATRSIGVLNRMILEEGHYFDSEWELDYASYFFSASQAMLVQKWISEGMKIPPEDLGRLYHTLAIDFWAKNKRQSPDSAGSSSKGTA